MNPRLIAITGFLKGTAFALSDGETSIGREGKNAVCLPDLSVSRQHCVINKIDDLRFLIRDAESYNGTFVNGVPVREHELIHGDQLAIGNVKLFFLLEEGECETVIPDHRLDDNLTSHSTIRLESEDAVYLRPDKLLAQLPQMARIARDLSVLLKIGQALSSVRELEPLQARLLELISEVVPAQRGAILLTGDAGSEIVSRCRWSRRAESDGVRISNTVVRQCLSESAALLCNGVTENKDLNTAESLIAAEVRSVLCVPIAAFEKTSGVIYLDTSDPNGIFDQDHLQLLTGIAGVAASPLENALRAEQLVQENRRLQEQINLGHKMIGSSPRIEEIKRFIKKAAPKDSTVLIRGESGTGKEIAAHDVHQQSTRKDKPFVAINCATLTETLLESELFGHERGAFTGAIAQKKGKFEIANGGTIFLDEIGEMATTLQAKLLRVLQEREFERLGGTKTIKVDVRVVAATNCDLKQAVSEGTFRADLFYRLNVVSLEMPPLRERREDIPLLVQLFINKYNERCNTKVKGVTPQARACLQSYNWPGNVRELENTIERAIVLSQTDEIGLEDLPESLIEAAEPNDQFSLLPYQDAVNEAKRRIVTEAIEKSDGNLTEAAKKIGIHPNNLHRLIRTLNLKPKEK